MSSDIFHELNPVLVAQVDAFAEVVEQRNLARDAAVCLEQELAAAEAENEGMKLALRAVASCVREEVANDSPTSLAMMSADGVLLTSEYMWGGS